MPKAKSKTPPADFAVEPMPVVLAPVVYDEPVVAPEPEILKRLDTAAKWSWALVAGGVVVAAGLSVFAVRGAMRKRREV